MNAFSEEKGTCWIADEFSESPRIFVWKFFFPRKNIPADVLRDLKINSASLKIKKKKKTDQRGPSPSEVL